MDADLDDILNDDPAAPGAPSAAPASSPAAPAQPSQPAPRISPSPSAEVEKEPDVAQEPIVEAAPMSTESAVLVSAPDMGEDIKVGKTNDDESLGATPAPVSTADTEKPLASPLHAVKPPASVASARSKPKETTAAEAKNSSGGDDGGWGLSSVTAALGGWGFGGSNDEADTAPTTALGSVESDPVEEEDWKHQAEAVEDAAAAAVAFLTGGGPSATTAAESVEEAMEEAANAASAAASSFFSGATEFLSGGGEDTAAASTAAATSAVPPVPPPDADDPTASALRAFYELNPMNKLASGWIDALERENADADPHRELRAHLDNHIKDWPRSTYEEWVEEALCALDGWDQGSAVVDDTFYAEDSVHRNIWNETNYQRAEEEGGEAQREFVPARGAGSAGAIAAKPQPATKCAAKASAGGADDDADLDGLIGGEEEIVFVENSEVSSEKK